jgi:hypothetical protein
MINLEVKLADPSWNAGAATLKNQLPQLSAQSFTALLSEALSETLSKFGIDPSTIQLTVQDQPSQSSATRQTLAATRETPVVAVPVATSPVGASLVATTEAAPARAMPSQHWYASTPADDAYWSKQPAAVQQLREIDDLDQRKVLGAELASAGYAIDVPIMVWGWDAGKVTAARQSYGYTWVPSALQSPVSAAPGVTGPGIIPYDPNNPPSGSIIV